MTLLIDPALWWHHGRRWSHLVSDADLAELHAFAARCGIPPRAFHGDHYDVPEEWRHEVVAAGAVEVTTRDVVVALRRAGLRLTAAERRATDWEDPDVPGGTTPGSG